MTDKEDCFKKAVEAYEKAKDEDLGVEFQQPWRQNVDGSWSREPRGFWAGVNSVKKWLMGEGHSGSATQIRRPDLTVDGNKVFDLKFTRKDGTVDDWRTQPGQGNGQTQRNDYEEINRQNDPGGQSNDNPKLDPESCDCKGRGKPEPVRVVDPSLAPYGYPGMVPFMPLPAPGGLPVMPGLPSFGPLFGPGLVPVPSSQRYKDDVQKADLRAERLLDLEVKSFRWKQDGRADIGLIAEEVHEAVPELYYEDASFAGVQAGHLPFYLLDLVKRQQAQIGELVAKIERLEEARAAEGKSA